MTTVAESKKALRKTTPKSRPVISLSVTTKTLHTQRVLRSYMKPVKTALFRIGVVLQAVADEKLIAQGNILLDKYFDAAANEIEGLRKQLSKVIADNGIRDFVNYTIIQEDTIEVDTPKLRRFLRVVEMTDELLALVDTLWLNELLEDYQKKKAGYAAESRIKHLGNQIIELSKDLNSRARSTGKEEEVDEAMIKAGLDAGEVPAVEDDDNEEAA